MTIYSADRTTGYLIASSQGNNTYVIYTREDNNEYVGTIQVTDGETVDGVQETDGIDVTNFGLGDAFPKGVFVTQDGINPGENQNFKLTSWAAIAQSFDPPLSISTDRDPRAVYKR